MTGNQVEKHKHSTYILVLKDVKGNDKSLGVLHYPD